MMADRIAFVTGGASGIGAATCRLLATQGSKVIVADKNLTGARDVCGSLLGDGHQARFLDVADESSIVSSFEWAETEIGPINILACIAGATLVRAGAAHKITATSAEDWDWTHAVNSRGVFLCVREFLRWREQIEVLHGRVIITSSSAAFSSQSLTGVAYAAAKASLAGLLRAAVVEAAERSITVNAIAPGSTTTPALIGALTESQLELLTGSNPLKRIGTPEEIASAIAFLASAEASYVTGATFHVNGGKVIV